MNCSDFHPADEGLNETYFLIIAKKQTKKQSKIVVQTCICRKEHEFIGEKCEYPMEI